MLFVTGFVLVFFIIFMRFLFTAELRKLDVSGNLCSAV